MPCGHHHHPLPELFHRQPRMRPPAPWRPAPCFLKLRACLLRTCPINRILRYLAFLSGFFSQHDAFWVHPHGSTYWSAASLYGHSVMGLSSPFLPLDFTAEQPRYSSLPSRAELPGGFLMLGSADRLEGTLNYMRGCCLLSANYVPSPLGLSPQPPTPPLLEQYCLCVRNTLLDGSPAVGPRTTANLGLSLPPPNWVSESYCPQEN